MLFRSVSQSRYNDPHLFGWTRSFTEDGVPHVVEIQSDLAQHAGKVLSEGERASIEQRQKQLTKDITALQDARHSSFDVYPKLRKALKEAGYKSDYPEHELYGAASRLYEKLSLEYSENSAKLSVAVPLRVSPILPHWPRRLIREELAKQAKAGASVVRFADADTVAKVEGWPESEEGEIYSSDTWDKSLIDRLELGDQTAEEDAILYVKIQNSLI